MAGREEFSVDLTVGKNEITEEAEEAAKALDELEGKDVEVKFKGDTSQVTRDIDDVLAKVDKLAGTGAAELLLTTNAAQVANQIVDLTTDIDKLDATDPTIDIKAENIATLEAGLDRLSAKAREISTTPVNVDTRSAVTGIDDIARSAGSSKSVLANMVGNATQDLGALGGIAGSAGVAIGQMGEYMVDASSSGDKLGDVVRNFGKVALPIAAIAGGIQLVTSAMNKGKEAAEAHADGIERMTAAAEEGTGVLGALADQIDETGKLAFTLGGGFDSSGIQVADLRENLDTLGLTMDDFVGLTELSESAMTKWVAGQKAAGVSESDLIAIAVARQEVMKQSAAAELDRAINARIGADAIDEQKAAEEAGKEATEAHSAAQEEAAERAAEYAEAVAEATRAWQEYVGVVKSVDWQEADVTGATAAMEAYRSELFGLEEIAINYQTALDAMNTAIAENGFNFDIATEAGRANQDVLVGMAEQIDTKLAAAYASANGDIGEFGRMSNDVFMQLANDLGLGVEQTAELRRQLGLTPEEVETRFKMSETEEALTKLGLLQGAIGALPTDVQLRIGAMIAEGDIVGAAHLATTAMNEAVAGGPPATFPTAADTSGAVADVGAFTGGDQPAATVPVGADPAEATGQVDDFVSETEDQEPIVGVDSDIKMALLTMAIINLVASQMRPVVTVTADPAPALATLNAIQRMEPWVGVNVYVADRPSASEIANMIGVVRVPVDAYVRTTVDPARLTGAR